jgi:hypothetical protein
MLLAAGFETASQLSALILAGQGSAWVLGVAFSFGMVLVDGLDGYLAGSTQRLAAIGQTRAKAASRALGIIVVIFAFGLGGAELFGIELTSVALPLGLSLFVIVIGLRIWARSTGPIARDTKISGVEIPGQIGRLRGTRTLVGHCPDIVECDVIFGVLREFAAIGPVL